MTDTSELAVLQRVADELEIRNLVARIFLLADQEADLDPYLDCFTEDAVWEARGKDDTMTRIADAHVGNRLVGRDALRADREHVRRSGHQGPGSRTYHVSTTLEVRVDDAETAEAESHWLFLRREEGGPKLLSVGSYLDRFVRTERGWKLAHRRFF
jgi:hypothetical protein